MVPIAHLKGINMKSVVLALLLFSLMACIIIVPEQLAWAWPNDDLIRSAESNDISGVKKALGVGADVNAR